MYINWLQQAHGATCKRGDTRKEIYKKWVKVFMGLDQDKIILFLSLLALELNVSKEITWALLLKAELLLLIIRIAIF